MLNEIKAALEELQQENPDLFGNKVAYGKIKEDDVPDLCPCTGNKDESCGSERKGRKDPDCLFTGRCRKICEVTSGGTSRVPVRWF